MLPLPKVPAIEAQTIELDENGFGTLELTASYPTADGTDWATTTWAPQMTVRQRVLVPAWATNDPRFMKTAVDQAIYGIRAAADVNSGAVVYWPPNGQAKVQMTWASNTTYPVTGGYTTTPTINVQYVWPQGVAYGAGIVGDWGIPPLSKVDQFRAKIKGNLRPSIEATNGYLMDLNNDPAERRARQLLSDLISREEFRRYLVRGFIMVKGRSGLLYKIYGGYKQMVSYKQDPSGKYEPFESYCIVFRNSKLPATDWVIMRKLIIDNEEFKLHQLAVVHRMSQRIAA